MSNPDKCSITDCNQPRRMGAMRKPRVCPACAENYGAQLLEGQQAAEALGQWLFAAVHGACEFCLRPIPWTQLAYHRCLPVGDKCPTCDGRGFYSSDFCEIHKCVKCSRQRHKAFHLCEVHP
jgi:hypothetical protein